MTVSIAIIGSGAWPLTIAKLCSDKHYKLSIWAHRQAIVDELLSTQSYQKSLQHTKLSGPFFASTSMEEVLKDADLVIFGLASSYMQHAVTMASYCNGKPIIILTKGLLNSKEYLFVTDYIQSLCPASSIGLLSGPNIASEINNNLPSATVIAAHDVEFSVYCQKILNHPILRVYTSQDLRGVEIGGVIKNILAIASGCCDGLGFGVNTKSALLTRGLQEIIRFSKQYNCDPQTFYGLSGLGDLIATCHSKDSRNYRFGVLLGEGKRREEALSIVNRTVEGVNTLSVIFKLAKDQGVELPIINEVYNVVFNGKAPLDSITSLMERNLKSEG